MSNLEFWICLGCSIGFFVLGILFGRLWENKFGVRNGR